ncbi:hypothetical protein GCM10009127_05830 [Alteraurantiacibacter aestuarii]|uniref:Secreted protein n=1 Tax=Alteraurantiacibacter aestuarii TaxID=650004 RepID=A0A844ZKU8_9SPHN|nr:hypothetical protein [Alteraurantiacibacter aestuarii]MXO89061.1 hypothetical protein [Alteraurantiacibacter aestuarii]
MSLTRGTLAAVALIATGLAVTPQSAEAGVVVSSSGPSAGQFPVGRQIGGNERITLRDGDSVTVLDNGGTRVLRGSGSFTLASQSGASQNRAFASLTTQRSATRARTGAVRSANVGEVSNPSLWYVDVSKAGTICLPADQGVRLWRADTQAESTYSVGTGNMTSRITFPAGEMLASWDASNPPSEGTTYQIGHGSGSNAVEVKFVFLDSAPSAAEELAATLIANGCMEQLNQMSSAMMGE